MITYYCPSCWTEYRTNIEVCPKCGYRLKEFDALEFEQKLLRSVRHPVASYRYLAIEILGKLKSKSALPLFAEILQSSETDYYLLRQTLEATAMIPGKRRRQILENATRHTSPLIAARAKELLETIN